MAIECFLKKKIKYTNLQGFTLINVVFFIKLIALMTKFGLSDLQSVKFNLRILDFYFTFKVVFFFKLNDIRKI